MKKKIPIGSDSDSGCNLKGFFEELRDELKISHRDKACGLTTTLKTTIEYTAKMDALLLKLFNSFSDKFNLSANSVALIALGGYGRGLLNIHSDIDMMLLYKKVTPELEALTKGILYLLWDAGLDVGFSMRSVKESVELAREDTKTKTTLLDRRFLGGSQELFDLLDKKIRTSIFNKKTSKDFIKEKIAEQHERHGKYGGSLYILEPNLKEGEGGLRDFHTAAWILGAKSGANSEETKKIIKGILSVEECASIDASLSYLHWIRNDLHLESSRATDRLTFDQQERIAKILGHKDKAGALAVESFMGDYYKHVSNIKTLSALIISRSLASDDETSLSLKLGIRRKNVGRVVEDDFLIEDGKLSLVDENLFNDNPAMIMKALYISTREDVELSQSTKDIILTLLESIGESLRSSKDVAKFFLKILRGDDVYAALSTMHDMGLLEVYIPEFLQIKNRVQHDSYHIYTVDRHSLFAVRELESLRGAVGEEFPLQKKLFEELNDPAILMLGVLFHDIGKGHGKGHAKRGAEIAPPICRRLGLSESEIDMVRFLIEEHLIIANTAQYRDLHDEKLILDFARAVADKERLNCLYLLTFADVRAVGPEVWTNWKGALFQELYFRALAVIERGSFDHGDLVKRVMEVRASVEELNASTSAGFTQKHIDNFFKILPARYFFSNSTKAIINHMEILEKLKKTPYVITVRQVKKRDYTEIVVAADDIHGLFSIITGVLTANSINILGAQINTTRNGIALDTLQIKNVMGGLLTSKPKIKKIEEELDAVISGRVKISTIVKRVKPSILDKKAKPHVPTIIHVDNDVSDVFSVLDIHTHDRPGLLYLISSTLTKMGIFIHISKISTKGDEATDILYVRDIFGQKILADDKVEELRDALYERLSKA